MPAIPENQCATVALSQVNTDAIYLGSDPDNWAIFYPNTSTTIASANFPGGTGTAAHGWSVTGNFASVMVCTPAGSAQTGTFTVRVFDTGGNPPGTPLTYYEGTFTVTAAIAPCARPAPPVFTAGVQGATIKLNGTG